MIKEIYTRAADEAGYDLKPGESHDLLMAVQSVPNDGSVHARHP